MEIHSTNQMFIQIIKYQSKHNSSLHKIQFRATCFDSLLSHLQALKEQIQGNQSFIVHFGIPNAVSVWNPKMHYKTLITLDLFLESLKMT